MFDEPEEFTCCRCNQVKPYVQANCLFRDLFDIDNYFCDACDKKETEDDKPKSN